MPLLVVDHSEVSALLPMAECMDAMADVLRGLAEGRAQLPLRSVMHLGGQNAFALMPAVLGSPSAIGAKVITVFPGNRATELDSHQGVVLLFEPGNGRLLAIMDASSITAIRTAAVSGVATRALAREGASVLAILGSGVQAVTHLEAMVVARPVREVRVWGRTAERARELAATSARRFGVPVEASASPRQAVAGADIICTTTSSREPVLMGDWIAPGAHVNAVGASVPAARELDTNAVARSRLYVDRRESALNEAGDFLIPRREGAFGDDHIVGEIGELLAGRIAGRRAPDEVTLFKSLGLAVEDVAAAHLIHDKAKRSGVGRWMELGGKRDAGA
ncbi:MAG: ornithine cyclodeaminase family protein [Gemmatimonadaceae bacterium]